MRSGPPLCFGPPGMMAGLGPILVGAPGAQPDERFPTNAATLGYSVARQARNGMIHLITSMNDPCLHFEFNEAWLFSDAPTTNSDNELMRSNSKGVADVKAFTEKFHDG